VRPCSGITPRFDAQSFDMRFRYSSAGPFARLRLQKTASRTILRAKNSSDQPLSLCGCRGRRKRPISATLDAYSKDRAFDSIPCRRRHCRMWSARACFCRPAVLLFAAIFPDNDSSLFAAKHLPLLSAFKKLFFDSTTDDLNAPCMRYRNLQSKSAPESTGVV
jgi:hypothetical protein